MKKPFLTCLFVVLLTGCGEEAPSSYTPSFADQLPESGVTLVFGVHPLHNPHKLFQVYQPLVDYLNRRLEGMRIRLEASRDYGEFERKLGERYFALALPNPYQTVISGSMGYRVFGKMGDDQEFRGLILVRKDSPVRTPADVKGKAVSYPAPTALAATMLPQWFLHTQGLGRDDIRSQYVGSQESSIMNVYLGKVVAGATWPPPWRAFAKQHPDIAAQLEVRWETPPLVNNGLVARDDLEPATVDKVAGLIFGLDRDPEGRAILERIELSRFEPANETTYAPVAEFIQRFERELRPAKEP